MARRPGQPEEEELEEDAPSQYVVDNQSNPSLITIRRVAAAAAGSSATWSAASSSAANASSNAQSAGEAEVPPADESTSGRASANTSAYSAVTVSSVNSQSTNGTLNRGFVDDVSVSSLHDSGYSSGLISCLTSNLSSFNGGPNSSGSTSAYSDFMANADIQQGR